MGAALHSSYLKHFIIYIIINENKKKKKKAVTIEQQITITYEKKDEKLEDRKKKGRFLWSFVSADVSGTGMYTYVPAYVWSCI